VNWSSFIRCGEAGIASGSEVKRFTVFTVSYGAVRIKHCVKDVIFRLHRIADLGDSVGNNTRYASDDFGYHAHPGGLLFWGAW
jgi:hypothetical protein